MRIGIYRKLYMGDSSGFLSSGDKEYLRGGRDYENEQSEAQRRYRLRNKVQQVIIDFSLLQKYIDIEDLSLLFQDIGPPVVGRSAENPGLVIPGGQSDMYDGLIGTLAFLYKGVKTQSDFDFERVLEQAIRQVGATRDSPAGQRLTNVNVEIERQYQYELDPDEIRERFETNPSRLTIEEIGKLVVAGKLNPDELEQLENHPAQRLSNRAIISQEAMESLEETRGNLE